MLNDDYNEEDAELTGSLLLAHPHLTDPNFARSVVLLTAHDSEGSLGVVINHDLGIQLKDVDAEFEKYGLGEVPLYVGGPVSADQIILAAWKQSRDSNEFKLYFGLQPNSAREKMSEDPDLVFRAFKGYSGWNEGQLVSELSDNAWVVAQVNGEAMSTLGGDELWKTAIMDINPELGLLSFAPETPEVN